MVWATKVFQEVTIIRVGNKAMGIMKLLRERLKIQKEVEKTLRVTSILGLGSKTEKDQRLEKKCLKGYDFQKQKEISRRREVNSSTEDIGIKDTESFSGEVKILARK